MANEDYALGVELKFEKGELLSNPPELNVALTISQTRYLCNIGEDKEGVKVFFWCVCVDILPLSKFLFVGFYEHEIVQGRI